MMEITDKMKIGQMPVTELGETFMQKYIAKYWHFVDRSNDGLLNYSEFKMAWSDIAAILVQVGLQIDDESTLVERNLRFAVSSDSEPIIGYQFINLTKRDLNLYDSNNNRLLDKDEIMKMSQNGKFSIFEHHYLLT